MVESQNGPVAHNVKYFNDMQIVCDVTFGSLPNVWRALEKALIISLHWFTEPFILSICTYAMKTRTHCTCFSEESTRKQVASCLSHGE